MDEKSEEDDNVMKYDYEGSFLESWPMARRGAIGNYFYQAARNGAETIDAMIEAVGAEAQWLFGQHGDAGESGQALRILLTVIDELETRKFAEHVLWRESLSYEERQRLKNESGANYRTAWMAQKPPTPKQLKYLEALACHVIPSNMAEASQLIDKYKNGVI